MSDNIPGPLKEVCPGAKSGATATNTTTTSHTTTRAEGSFQSKGIGRVCGGNPVVRRHADMWRAGFSAGFRDALRLAARRTDDPEVWTMLSRLAAEYELVGGDR